MHRETARSHAPPGAGTRCAESGAEISGDARSVLPSQERRRRRAERIPHTMERLKALLNAAAPNLPRWVIGRAPSHYKRINIESAERWRLAKIGQAALWAAYGCKLYFSQAVIAGAMLSGDYDSFYIVTPSQYGKSWLMGRVALLQAFRGRNVYIAGATGDKAEIINAQVLDAVQDSAAEMQAALLGMGRDKLGRLNTSVSKRRISFSGRGSVEPITLGDTYDGKEKSKAVGRGGNYIVDEAALVSSEAIAELGRRDFVNIDGSKAQLVMISNPHKPGEFYDRMTMTDVPPRTLILWMDALTAVEEERFSREQVLTSDYAKQKSTRTVYLMCELEEMGAGMFDMPRIEPLTVPESCVHAMGIDAAYKGKDNIELCHVWSDGQTVCVSEIVTLEKRNWIDGVTSQEIINSAARVYQAIKCSKCCVDIGQGIWLVEGLSRYGLNVNGINFGAGPTPIRKKGRHYAATNADNMRAEMHLDLQMLIESKKLVFTPSAWEKVKDGFGFVASERLPNGKIRIRPKIEIKNMIGHSPDALDAVLLAVHALVMNTWENNAYITD